MSATVMTPSVHPWAAPPQFAHPSSRSASAGGDFDFSRLSTEQQASLATLLLNLLSGLSQAPTAPPGSALEAGKVANESTSDMSAKTTDAETSTPTNFTFADGTTLDLATKDIAAPKKYIFNKEQRDAEANRSRNQPWLMPTDDQIRDACLTTVSDDAAAKWRESHATQETSTGLTSGTQDARKVRNFKKRVILQRHGNAENNAWIANGCIGPEPFDPDLTALGRWQTDDVGKQVSELVSSGVWSIDALSTSPLSRPAETAMRSWINPLKELGVDLKPVATEVLREDLGPGGICRRRDGELQGFTYTGNSTDAVRDPFHNVISESDQDVCNRIPDILAYIAKTGQMQHDLLGKDTITEAETSHCQVLGQLWHQITGEGSKYGADVRQYNAEARVVELDVTTKGELGDDDWESEITPVKTGPILQPRMENCPDELQPRSRMMNPWFQNVARSRARPASSRTFTRPASSLGTVRAAA